MKVIVKCTREIKDLEFRYGLMGTPYFRDWASGVDYGVDEVVPITEKLLARLAIRREINRLVHLDALLSS